MGKKRVVLGKCRVGLVESGIEFGPASECG